MIKYIRFPNWKEKALTLSYDDGVEYDKRLIEIMNKYSLKGTFNINSGLFGANNIRLLKEEAYNLYVNSDNEIAIHGEKHLSLGKSTLIEGITDIYNDKNNLEKMFNRIIRGMAYANGSFNDRIIPYIKEMGICYSRTTISTGGFNLPEDWLRLQATCHHKDIKLFNYVENFLEKQVNSNQIQNPLLFYLWGHSYEFENDNNWKVIEEFAAILGNRNDIWYATNIDIYDYVQAYNNLVFSLDLSLVYNPSCIDVYLNINGENIYVKSGETKKL